MDIKRRRNEGTLSISGTDIFESPNNVQSSVLSIICSNPAAYQLTLELYNFSTGLTTKIYELNLAAGDTLIDSTRYLLNGKDRLIMTSDIAGTTYNVVGETYFPT